MVTPAFLGGSYVAQSPTALNERTMNFYPELLPMPGGKSKVQLYPTPGVTTFATSGYGPTRGSFYQNGRVFFAKGTKLMEYDETGTETDRGSLLYSSSHPVTFAANGDAGDQLMIVVHQAALDNGQLRILDLGTNTISTPVISPAPVMGAYLDGYFLFLDTLSTLYKSALYDGTSWDATHFAQRSAAPDPWKAVAVNKANKTIGLFGEETSEFWYDAGAPATMPFKPIPGALIPYGIAAPYSVKQVGKSLIWLSRTSSGQGEVVQVDGLVPKVISTPALTTALAAYDTIGDAVGDTYEALGHTFYLLTFPAAGATWVYDLTTGLWHERGTWISEDNEYVASRTRFHTFAFGKLLAGDSEDGTIYEVTNTSSVDVDDRPMRRLRRGPSISFENKRLFFPRFEVFLESGLASLGDDPQVMLRYSNNGGKTWSSELWRSAGVRGDYGRRVYWNNLGSGRDRQYELVMSDEAPWRLIDAFQEVEAGTEVNA